MPRIVPTWGLERGRITQAVLHDDAHQRPGLMSPTGRKPDARPSERTERTGASRITRIGRIRMYILCISAICVHVFFFTERQRDKFSERSRDPIRHQRFERGMRERGGHSRAISQEVRSFVFGRVRAADFRDPKIFLSRNSLVVIDERAYRRYIHTDILISKRTKRVM